MTIRERIAAIQKELRDEDVLPQRAREILHELSGLYGNVIAEATRAEVEFAKVQHECFQQQEKANRAEMAAKATPQYERMREAQATLKLVGKMSNAVSKAMDSLNTEMRLGGR